MGHGEFQSNQKDDRSYFERIVSCGMEGNEEQKLRKRREEFLAMDDDAKKQRIKELWHKAKVEVDKIRFKTRL